MGENALPVVVIAAAGRARRFAGEQKVVATVGGRPAICRVAEACAQALGPHRQLVVIGHQGAQVRAALGEAEGRAYVVQEEQLGTGHVLATALAHLEEVPARKIFFVCGDKPLLSARSLQRVRDDLAASGAAMSFLVGTFPGDIGHNRQGRVLQVHPDSARAEALAIVERATIDSLAAGETLAFRCLAGHRHAYSRERLLALREVNLSTYGWPEAALRAHLHRLPRRPEKDEYFVTDLVAVLREQHLRVRAVAATSRAEQIGIDTPEQLVEAERAWRQLQPAGV